MQNSNQSPEDSEEKKAENVAASSPFYEFSTPYVPSNDEEHEEKATIAETGDASALKSAPEVEGQHKSAEALSHQGLVYPPPPSFYQQAQFTPGQPLSQASMPMYSGMGNGEMPSAQSVGYMPQGEYARMQSPPFAPIPPMQPAPKKSYRWLWITISILVVFLLAACGLCGWAFSQFVTPIVQSETNVINVTNEYYDALHSNDYASAYQYLMPKDSIQGMTLATFTQRAQSADKQYGTIRSYTTGAVNVVTNPNTGFDFSRFTVVVNITRPGQSYSALLTLQKIGDTWKITDFDRL